MKIRFTWVAAVLALLLPACEAAVDVPANRTVKGCGLQTTVETLDFGTVEVGDAPVQRVEVSLVDSTCPQPSFITSAHLADGTGFTLDGTAHFEWGTNSIEVRFTGTEAGEYMDTLILNNDPSLNVVLRAERVEKPFIVTPDFIDVGEILTGHVKEYSLKIKNPTNRVITIDRIRTFGAYLTLHGVNAPFSLKPQSEVELTVRFSAVSGVKGEVLDSISIEGEGYEVVVQVKAAISQEFAVIVTDLDFGDVQVGTAKEMQFHIRNLGDESATVMSILVGGPDQLEFDLTYAGAPFLPLTIAPGEEIAVGLRYSPTTIHSSNVWVECSIVYNGNGAVDNTCVINARGVQ